MSYFGLGAMTLEDQANYSAVMFASLGRQATCQAYRTGFPTGGSYDQAVCEVAGSGEYFDVGLTSQMTPAQVQAALDLERAFRQSRGETGPYEPIRTMFTASNVTAIGPPITAQVATPATPATPVVTPATPPAVVTPSQPGSTETRASWCARYPTGSWQGQPCTAASSGGGSTVISAGGGGSAAATSTVSDSVAVAQANYVQSAIDQVNEAAPVIAGVNNWFLIAAAAAAAWWMVKQ